MNGRGKSRPNKASRSGRNVGKQHFIASTTSSGSALRVRVADDISRQSMAPDLGRMSMPKNLQTQIHWFQSSCQFTQSLGANVLTEFNFPFSLGDLSVSGAIAALFDQYAIFAVNSRIAINSSPTVSTAIPVFMTAIDYDSVGNLGSVSKIKEYSTVCITTIAETQERYLEPCNAPALYSGAAFTHYGQSRMWVDASNVSTPHYGLRIIVAPLGAAVTGSIIVENTYVVCARNVV